MLFKISFFSYKNIKRSHFSWEGKIKTRISERGKLNTVLLPRRDSKGFLEKEDAVRLQKERAREEPCRLAEDTATGFAKNKA